MGFKTIDLDSPGGYDRYNRMKATNSVKAAFADEEPITEKIEKQNEEALKDVVKGPEPNIVKTGTVVGVQSLRVREKPEGEVLYLISEKSVVKVLEDHDGWYKVETAPGRIGFVMSQFIQVRTEGG